MLHRRLLWSPRLIEISHVLFLQIDGCPCERCLARFPEEPRVIRFLKRHPFEVGQNRGRIVLVVGLHQ